MRGGKPHSTHVGSGDMSLAERPAPESLPSLRRWLWEPRPRVQRIPTWTRDYPQNARFMGNVEDLFWCDTRDDQGCLLHAPDCDQRDCFVVQGKKQETKTGGNAKLPDHYSCRITWAFWGRRKHNEDECYHKERLSAKLKTRSASGKGSGKGNTDKDSGQGKFKGNGKGGRRKGKGGQGGSDHKPDKDNNANRSRGKPNTAPGANSESSGRQPNPGPTSRCKTQAEQAQGTKRANEDWDQSNACERMAQKPQKKGFEVTCHAEF